VIPDGVSLDLIELDGKATPSAIVGEILRQNPNMPLPVPLEAIAALGGIKDIQELTTEGFEGMLLTNPEKSEGVIAVKANGNPQRRRFTLGHELGHYFLPWHRQTSFSCTAESIKEAASDSKAARGVEMEAEANAFASEILMPTSIFKKKLRAFGDPDIEQVVRLSEAFDTSIEATARRYLNLSDYPVAFVFSHHSNIRYWSKGPEFPYVLSVRNGHPLPKESLARLPGEGVSETEELDSDIWLDASRGKRLPERIYEQTLHQQDGYKVSLLLLDDIPDDEDD
jgi:Zn-dependent peptidase ImmA (M78 family)